MKRKVDPLDKAIEQEYYRQGDGVQVNIMDISKIFADCKRDIGLGLSLEAAMQNAINKYGHMGAY